MRKTRIIAFVMALVSMCLFGLLLLPSNKDKTENYSEPMVTVVKAASDIKAYTVIDQSMMTLGSVPESAVHPNSCLSPESAAGCIATADIAAGEVILSNHILTEDGVPSDLVLCVPDAHRAMSVRVSDTTGISGLLKVGDRVDVISVVSNLDPAHDQRAVSLTLVQDREVLAIDQVMMDAPRDENGVYSYKNVTLALLPDEVPKLAAAQYEGEVFLVLRPLEESSRPEIRSYTLDRAL